MLRFYIWQGMISRSQRTDFVPADVYGSIEPLSATAGGLFISGFSDSDAKPLIFKGTVGSASPTVSAIQFRAAKTNGGTSITNLADDEIAFQFGDASGLPAVLNIYGSGAQATGGPDPGLSSCGTTPSIVGSDYASKVTIGSGVTTSCTITFANTGFANAPACVVTGDNTAIGYAATTTTTVLTITSSADMASDVISFICVGT